MGGYGNGGNYIGTTSGRSVDASFAPPAVMGAIPTVLDEQTKQIATLHEAISGLEAKLQLVLQPMPVEGTGGNIAANPVQIIERIMDGNRGIDTARSRIVGLIERLQV